MNRRGFLGALLAAAAAPAIVRAGSLMPVYVPRPSGLLTLWGDGVHDDTAALQAMLMGAAVRYGTAILEPNAGRIFLPPAIFKLSDTLTLSKEKKALHVSGAQFVADASMPESAPMIYAEHGAEGSIQGCHFNRGVAFGLPGGRHG